MRTKELYEKPIFLLAKNVKIAILYAKSKNIPSGKYHFITKKEDVYGINNCKLIKINDWYESDIDFFYLNDKYCKSHNIEVEEVNY